MNRCVITDTDFLTVILPATIGVSVLTTAIACCVHVYKRRRIAVYDRQAALLPTPR